MDSSSPDPLTAGNGPTVAATPTRGRSRLSATPRKSIPFSLPAPTTAVDITPRKMTTTSNSTLSPWRIKVVVEAERESDEEGNGLPQWDGRATTITVPVRGLNDDEEMDVPRRLAGRKKTPPPSKRSPKKSTTRSRTKTTTVPVKGLESTPAAAEDAPAPKRRATPRKATPARSSAGVRKTQPRATGGRKKKVGAEEASKEVAQEEQFERAGTEDVIVLQSEIEPEPEPVVQTKAKTTKPRSTRKPGSKAAVPKPEVPTLASTRTRRSSIAPDPPMAAAATPRSGTGKGRASSVLNETMSPRVALSDKDRNTKLSPTPVKNSFRSVTEDSSLAKRLLNASGTPKASPCMRNSKKQAAEQEDEDDEDGIISPEDVIDSETFHDNLEPLPEPPGASSDDDAMFDGDFTYLPARTSYTPRVQKKRGVGLGDTPKEQLFEDNAVGIDSFYGASRRRGDDLDDEEMDVQGEEKIEDEVTANMLPSDSEDEQPAELEEADFTYMPNSTAYTPRAKIRRTRQDSEGLQLFDDSVGVESFYGLPSSERRGRDRKGKGKAVDRSFVSPNDAAEQSVYPSSPPDFEVVIYSPRKQTPRSSRKRSASPTLPDNPPPVVQKRRTRETPDLTRVVEGSSVLSDAMEVTEAMEMCSEEFGARITRPAQQPTPESEGYGSAGEAGPSNTAEDDAPHRGRQTQSGSPKNSSLLSPPRSRDPGSPYRRRLLNSPKSALRPTPKVKPRRTGAGTVTSPPDGRSVHFNDDPVEHTPPAADLASLEKQWAQERADNARNARDAAAIAVLSDEDEANAHPEVTTASRSLEEQWQAERDEVRRKAAEVGTIVIVDSSSPDMTMAESSGESFENQQDTAAFEESLAKHLQSGPPGVLSSSPAVMTSDTSRPPTNVFTTRSTISSRSTSPHATASTATYTGVTTRERARIVSTVDSSAPSELSATSSDALAHMLPENLLSLINSSTSASSTSSVSSRWGRKQYQHLSLLLGSSKTIPVHGKRIAVELIEPRKNLPDVLPRLDIVDENFLVLSELETAAVERFLSREKKMGENWEREDVVRGVASMVIARARREVKGQTGVSWRRR